MNFAGRFLAAYYEKLYMFILRIEAPLLSPFCYHKAMNWANEIRIFYGPKE